MDDLRARLSHVLWIGGGPCAGKSTLAELIASTHDLTLYDCDWHHAHEHGQKPGGVPPGWYEQSMDQRWLLPSPQALADRDLASWTTRFTFVIQDLLARPTDRPIIAEGPSVFPWSVASVIEAPSQAVFLMPTRRFREDVLARRDRHSPGSRFEAKTSDPDAARRNRLDRDDLMAERIAASCDELGLRRLPMDGSRDLGATVALLEEHFRPHLPPRHSGWPAR